MIVIICCSIFIISILWFSLNKEIEVGKQMINGQQVGEIADHSFVAHFVDWNNDLWPDLVVANDMGNRLRVYRNHQGRYFVRIKNLMMSIGTVAGWVCNPVI